MTLTFKTTILLDGKELPIFKELRLQQRIHAHHILEARIPLSALENEDYHDLLEKSLAIEILTNNAQKEKLGRLEFNGIITSITISRGSNVQGDELSIIASSKEILANDGPHYNCFHESKLDDIVKKTFSGYGFDIKTKSTFKEVIDYTVQNHESAFNFIKRLSEKYGQWLYYNGKQLIFGKPEENSIPLKYNHDLAEYEMKYNPTPQKFKYFTQSYLEKEGKHWQYIESAKPKGVNGDSGKVYDKSDTLFGNETHVWVNANNERKYENIIKGKAKVQKAGLAIQQVKLIGYSWNSGVALGNIVEIKDQKYRVTEVTHTLRGMDGYENHFEAVSANIEGYPYTNINAYTSSQSQIAAVVDNNDPEKLGRIKVAFAWQELIGETTPWIRVISSHAGDGQGVQFLPEIGDQVLVDFEGGDAESPYVIGAMYHKKNKPLDEWASPDNDIKVIQTRSGHTIKLNDKSNEESITISDKKGNSITLDTKEGGITISAPTSLTLSSKDITIEASNDLNVSAKNKANVKALEITADAKTNMTLKSKAKLTADSAEVGIKGKATAKLEGAMVDINGSGMTNIKGGVVNLN